jgi:hypothetical protein
MLKRLCVLSILMAISSGCGDNTKEEIRKDVCPEIFKRIVEVSRECSQDRPQYYFRGYAYCLHDNCCFSSKGGRELIDLNKQYGCVE